MNCEFYKKIYIDVRNFTDTECLQHYKDYGYLEGRVCNKKMLDFRVKKNLKIANLLNQELDSYSTKNKEQNLINLIIRTSNRPKCFKINIESIISQNYSNLNIFISYDNDFTNDYIDDILSNFEINYEKISVSKTNNNFYYNDYPNQILDKINDGYVIFLDDDDMFLHKNSLLYINDFLNEDIFLSWNYLRSDKIIGIVKGNVKSGKLTSCGFCYHSSKKSKWEMTADGDFKFAKNLIENNNLKFGKIDRVLTANINKNIIYGEGKCEDI